MSACRQLSWYLLLLLITTATTTPITTPESCQFDKVGSLNQQQLRDHLDVDDNGNLSDKEMQKLTNIFEDSLFAKLTTSKQTITFIKECANVTLPQNITNGINDDSPRNGNNNNDPEEKHKCNLKPLFFQRFLKNTCIAGTCGVHREDDQARILTALIDELYGIDDLLGSSKTTCLAQKVLPYQDNRPTKKKETGMEVVEKVETVFKYWFWIATIPILIKSYWARQHGRRNSKYRSNSVVSVSTVMSYIKKLFWNTYEFEDYDKTHFPFPLCGYTYQYDERYIMMPLAIVGASLLQPSSRWCKNTFLRGIKNYWVPLWFAKEDDQAIQREISSWYEECQNIKCRMVWSLSFFIILVASGIVLTSFVYFALKFAWMTASDVDKKVNLTDREKRRDQQAKARKEAIKQWTAAQGRETGSENTSQSHTSIEDNCFNELLDENDDLQEDGHGYHSHNNSQHSSRGGYHDLGSFAPWQDSRDMKNDQEELQITGAPLKDVTPLPIRPFHSQKQSTSMLMQWRQQHAKITDDTKVVLTVNGTNEEESKRERNQNSRNESKTEEFRPDQNQDDNYASLDWIKKDVECYAKPSSLRWACIKRISNGKALEEFQMVQHRLYTFSWSVPFPNAVVKLNGNELARLSHEIATRLFLRRSKQSSSFGILEFGSQKDFVKIEVVASSRKGIGMKMRQSFIQAGKTYRVRGRKQDEKNNNTTTSGRSKTKNTTTNTTSNSSTNTLNLNDGYELGSNYDSSTVQCHSGNENEIIVSYYFEDQETNHPSSSSRIKQKRPSLPSHIGYHWRTDDQNHLVMDIQVWQQSSHNSTHACQLNTTIQHELTKHVALSNFKALFKAMDQNESKEVKEDEEQSKTYSCAMDALRTVGTRLHKNDTDIATLSLQLKLLTKKKKSEVVSTVTSKVGSRRVAKKEAEKYQSALQLYYNIGRKDWVNPTKEDPQEDPQENNNNNNNNNNEHNNNQTSIGDRDSGSVAVRHPRSPCMTLVRNLFCCKKICASKQKRMASTSKNNNSSSSRDRTTKRLSPMFSSLSLLRCHALRQENHDGWNTAISPPRYLGNFVSGSGSKESLEESTRNNRPLSSSPFARYFYGKILKRERQSTSQERGREPYCLVEFNDGIMWKRTMWVSCFLLQQAPSQTTTKKKKKKTKHYCYYRRIQHRYFFSDEPNKTADHRHWCYGSPPPIELGGPPSSTLKAVKKTTAKRSWLRRNILLKGKEVWYSGCAQCHDCKEYFCIAHIQSHRIDSDKGCRGPHSC